MLVEFRVSNFRSFNDKQTFSFVAGRDSKHKDHLIDIGPIKLLKCASVYGANASGKSNLIQALDVMERFVRISATRMNQGDKIPGIVPFRLCSTTTSQPSRFGITVLLGKSLYEYGFSATAEKVFDEWLTTGSVKGSRRTLFRRTCDPSNGKTTWSFGKPLAEEGPALRERTRDNGLALSRGAEQNVKPLSRFFLWFVEKMWILDLSHDPRILVRKTAMRMKENTAFAERVGKLVRDADMSIESIKVEEGAPPSPKAREVIKLLLREEALRKIEEKAISQPSIRTAHRIEGTDVLVDFDMRHDESNGTQRFFALAGPLLDALDKGALVVVDEIDCSMHPLLTRKLIELFQSPSVNTKGAQLLFTTHDSSLMTPALFRRDEVWLAEKDQGGASRLFSLYDFRKPRSTESFSKNYLAGRYGGVPDFGPTFEDLEIQ